MSGSVLPARLRVTVGSEQALVAEAVRVALASRDFEAVTLRWPGEQTPPRPRRGPVVAPDVGLLISDLDRWPRLRAASVLVSRVTTQWVVLTSAPRGPLWGAVIEAGAALVLPSLTSLDEIEALLRSVAAGESRMAEEEQAQLAASWEDFRDEHREVSDRVQSLTPREDEVLRLLYAGDSVAQIASLLEISPATVRSQVKAVLRKLEVSSQLGAVAQLGTFMEHDLARRTLAVPPPSPKSGSLGGGRGDRRLLRQD